MRASARVLGQQLGLTARELNHALKEAGFLAGDPGAYSVTEKGAKFAAEQYHSRGTGGYSWYNRAWETRTWDESVLAALNLSEGRKMQIRRAVSEAARQTRAARIAPASEAISTNVVSTPGVSAGRVVKVVSPWSAAAAAAAYGISRAAPKAREWLNER